MEVLVRPLVSKAFDEDIALGLHTSEQVFVIGQRPARLPVDLWELHFVEKLSSIKDVRKASKRVVKVLHLGSIDKT